MDHRRRGGCRWSCRWWRLMDHRRRGGCLVRRLVVAADGPRAKAACRPRVQGRQQLVAGRDADAGAAASACSLLAGGGATEAGGRRCRLLTARWRRGDRAGLAVTCYRRPGADADEVGSGLSPVAGGVAGPMACCRPPGPGGRVGIDFSSPAGGEGRCGRGRQRLVAGRRGRRRGGAVLDSAGRRRCTGGRDLSPVAGAAGTADGEVAGDAGPVALAAPGVAGVAAGGGGFWLLISAAFGATEGGRAGASVGGTRAPDRGGC